MPSYYLLATVVAVLFIVTIWANANERGNSCRGKRHFTDYHPSKYCYKCGTKLESFPRCPSCTREYNPSYTRYCPECGQKLPKIKSCVVILATDNNIK